MVEKRFFAEPYRYSKYQHALVVHILLHLKKSLYFCLQEIVAGSDAVVGVDLQIVDYIVAHSVSGKVLLAPCPLSCKDLQADQVLRMADLRVVLVVVLVVAVMGRWVKAGVAGWGNQVYHLGIVHHQGHTDHNQPTTRILNIRKENQFIIFCLYTNQNSDIHTKWAHSNFSGTINTI